MRRLVGEKYGITRLHRGPETLTQTRDDFHPDGVVLGRERVGPDGPIRGSGRLFVPIKIFDVWHPLGPLW